MEHQWNWLSVWTTENAEAEGKAHYLTAVGDKESPIGKSATPRCFRELRDKKISTSYYSNNIA